MLATPADPRNTYKVFLRENGIVIGQERGALPRRQGRRKKGVRAVKSTVEAESDGGSAGIVGVLDELFEHRRPLRVVH